MFCPKCGAEVRDGAKFCPKCGNVMQAQTTSQGYKSAVGTGNAQGTSISIGKEDTKYIVFLGIAILQLIIWNVGGLKLDFTSIAKYSDYISIYDTLKSYLNISSISFGSIFTKIPSLLNTVSSYFSMLGLTMPNLGSMSTANTFFYILVIAGALLCVYAIVTKKEIFDTSIVPCIASIYTIVVALKTKAQVSDLAVTYLHSSKIVSLSAGGVILIIVCIACIGYTAYSLIQKYGKK